jgi:pyridoxamine 5'-phosphate oxidase
LGARPFRRKTPLEFWLRHGRFDSGFGSLSRRSRGGVRSLAGDGARRRLVDEARHRHRDGTPCEAKRHAEDDETSRPSVAETGGGVTFVVRFCHKVARNLEVGSILPLNSFKSINFTEADDPMALFASWFVEANGAEINDPESMSLATVDAEGLPDVRAVLCKSFDADGLVFYTNAESAKGRQLAAVPKAAALFHWKSLRRQARFRGAVTLLDEAAADAYYHSRPRVSQIGAWASQQSRPLESRDVLEASVEKYAKQFGDGEIPRPAYWRGFRLTPIEIEFWKDGAFRLHDRVRFTRDANGWSRQRLYP